MVYLKKYGIKNEQIKNLEDRYNEGIISFLKENEIFVNNTIQYLYSENIKCIYILMINNIKLFLETQLALKKKINSYREKGLTTKEIQLKLMQDI